MRTKCSVRIIIWGLWDQIHAFLLMLLKWKATQKTPDKVLLGKGSWIYSQITLHASLTRWIWRLRYCNTGPHWRHARQLKNSHGGDIMGCWGYLLHPPPQHVNHHGVNKIFKFKPRALFPAPFIADTRAAQTPTRWKLRRDFECSLQHLAKLIRNIPRYLINPLILWKHMEGQSPGEQQIHDNIMW